MTEIRKSLPGFRGSAWTLISTSFASGIVQFDATLLNVALPSIRETTGASVPQLQWIVNGYTLGFLALLLIAGAIGDRFGARRVLLAGFIFFAIASLACAFAITPQQLIMARVLQGIGAALLVPNSLGLLKGICGDDGKRLARALGVWTAVGGGSYAAGPLVGGALLAVADWQFVFIANIPLCVIGFLAGFRNLTSQDAKVDSSSWDWGGQAMIVVSLLALALAITASGALGIKHPIVAIAMLVFAAGSALLVWIERTVDNPILPPALFANTNFNAALAYGFLINLSFAGVVFVLSLYLQSARGLTPLEAGIAFIPLTVTFIASNTGGGWLVAKYGLHFPMTIGALSAALGYALLFRLGENATMNRMLAGFVLIPVGVGITTPATMVAILACVRPALAGTASAVLSVAQLVASLLGVACVGWLIGDGSQSSILAGIDIAVMSTAGLLVCASILGWFVGSCRQ